MNDFGAREIRHGDVLYVARNMREEDAREIYAVRWTDSPEDLAADCIKSSFNFGWTFGRELPICAVGGHVVSPKVWAIWMFATNDFHKVALSVTKFCRKRMIPILLNHCNRAYCNSIEGHSVAHRWIESLGAFRESSLVNFGKNKETFHTYVWRVENNQLAPL